ncbi:UNVERIFIED_CONTAM: hypothetical protein HDU68_012780 [Siphonaria sp. JEL0065]|nr:hypothetical protein HDU68_012780 [Siphonaria sp. JEL0065]
MPTLPDLSFAATVILASLLYNTTPSNDIFAMSESDRTPLLSESTATSSTTIDKSVPSDTPKSTNDPLKKQIAELLESHPVHWMVIVLTIIDLLIVFAEIVFTLNDQCGGESSTSSFSSTLEVLGAASTGILFVFAFEIGLRFFAFGIEYFTKSGLHALDAVIVIVSLLFDFTLEGWAESIFSLLIVARAWRVVRVIDAVVLTVSEGAEETIAKLEEEIKTLKEEVATLKGKAPNGFGDSDSKEAVLEE